MNDRERFIQTMTFGNPDRIPLWECAFWGETFDRWLIEGLPDHVIHPEGSGSHPTEQSLCEYFGFDKSFGVYFRNTVKVNIDMEPGFTHKILSEIDGIITEIGGDGVVSRWSREGHSTRQYINFPVETREDLKKIRSRFDPNTPERFRQGWKENVLSLQAQGAPVCVNVGGYYGFARSLMGFENLSFALCDQVDLIEEIFEMRTEYITQILEKILQEVKPDFAEFWEDMAYKTGPLVSPKLYRKLALKHYQKITALLRKHDVNVILLDSDGNIDELIPIWIDGGITSIWPFEIAAGMDPVAVRKKYGKDLGIIGGIDKRVLAKGKAEIKEEIMKIVPFLISTGGFIPSCDHAVPPDVSFENYQYYLKLIKDIAGIR